METNEVFRVDDHSVELNDGVPELTVTGRSLTVFPENRIWRNAPYGKKISMAKKYSIRQAAEVWLWNAICNGTGNDRIHTASSYPAANQLPNVIVTDSVPPASDGPNIARKVQIGDVYSQLLTFLSSGKLGIRIIRPNGTSGRKVSVDSDGVFSTDHVDNIDKLRFDIYRGRDLTDKIVFSWKAGHLLEPTYYFASTVFKTGAFVDGDPRTHYYTDPDAVAGTNAGWNRLDAYVDGGSKDDGTTADDFEDSLEDAGLKAVRKDGKRVSSVEATISPDANFKYNRDYRLGDQVMVQGRYGAKDKKYVIEFIRSHDDNGDIGTPTLSSTLS